MERTLTKINRFAIATAMVAAVAGCGASQASQTTSTASAQLASIYNKYVKSDMPGVPLSVLEGAEKEGTVNWYALKLPAANDAVVTAFEKEFPFIHVNLYMNSGPLVYQKFLTEEEAGKGQADVLEIADPTEMATAVSDGYIANYTLAAASDYNLTPNDYQAGYWYPYGETVDAVVLYNTKLVNGAAVAALSQYPTLWSGAYTGDQLALPDAATQSNGQVLMYYLNEKYGQGALEKLAAVHPLLEDTTTAAAAVGAGSSEVAVVSEAIAATEYASGAPVAWTVPTPALGEPWPEAVVKTAPDPDAARLLQQFVLSAAGQAIFQENGLPSYRKGVTAGPSYASASWFTGYSSRTYVDINWTSYGKQVNAVISEYDSVFGR